MGAEQKAEAERTVAQFRQMMAAGQFQEIYRRSSPVLKQASTERDTVRFLRTVTERMGEHTESTQTGWHVNVSPAGARVSLAFTSYFANGGGTEQFVIDVPTGGQGQLAGYNFSSPTLLYGPEPEAGGNTASPRAERNDDKPVPVRAVSHQ